MSSHSDYLVNDYETQIAALRSTNSVLAEALIVYKQRCADLQQEVDRLTHSVDTIADL